MPRAPAGVKVPDLFMDHDGHWFVDGEKIEHARTLQVLTENVRLAADGVWVTSIGREEAPMRFADVPFFVNRAELQQGVLHMRLSDDSEEQLRSAEFRRGDAQARDENALYVRVKTKAPIPIWARFSRAAYQALLPHWQEKNGVLILPLADGAAELR